MLGRKNKHIHHSFRRDPVERVHFQEKALRSEENTEVESKETERQGWIWLNLSRRRSAALTFIFHYSNNIYSTTPLLEMTRKRPLYIENVIIFLGSFRRCHLSNNSLSVLQKFLLPFIEYFQTSIARLYTVAANEKMPVLVLVCRNSHFKFTWNFVLYFVNNTDVMYCDMQIRC